HHRSHQRQRRWSGRAGGAEWGRIGRYHRGEGRLARCRFPSGRPPPVTLVTTLVLGLSIGAVYALLAAGVTVVYQATRVPNVAIVAIGTVAALLHGDLMTRGGRLGAGLGWWPAMAISALVAVALGLGCDLVTRGLR